MLTNDPAAFLAELQGRDIQFVVAGDRLRWKPRESVTDEEVVLLRQHKLDLIQLLRHGDDQPIKAVVPVPTVAPPQVTPSEPWWGIVTRHSHDTAGQTAVAFTPHALRDDDHLMESGIIHKQAQCPSLQWWRHVHGGRYCSTCWPCTDPLARVEGTGG